MRVFTAGGNRHRAWVAAGEIFITPQEVRRSRANSATRKRNRSNADRRDTCSGKGRKGDSAPTEQEPVTSTPQQEG